MSLRHPIHIMCHNILRFNTGWRRLIGCLKLQVIFRKRATNYGALLRKMTYKDKAFRGYCTFDPNRHNGLCCSELQCVFPASNLSSKPCQMAQHPLQRHNTLQHTATLCNTVQHIQNCTGNSRKLLKNSCIHSRNSGVSRDSGEV